MNVKILKFNLKYLDDITISFAESFSDWSVAEVKDYLMQAYNTYPEYCFMAINIKDDDILGAIFSKICPYNKGKMILVESLQVKKESRGKGVGKLLMKKIHETAKKKKIISIGMLVSKNKNFPLSWFKDFGFKETGWVELAANTEDIKII